MELLIHTCCASCLSGSRIPFDEEGWDVTGFFFNPNIMPWTEYRKRLVEVRRYAEMDPIKMIYEIGYPLMSTIQYLTNSGALLDEEGGSGIMSRDEQIKRCRNCYRERLYMTARTARDRGFDAFTTTLLISKYQDHQGIRDIAKEISESVGVDFLYRDLRKYWGKSLNISRRYHLYRQQYCGCIFSEQERYIKEISSGDLDYLSEKERFEPRKKERREDQSEDRER